MIAFFDSNVHIALLLGHLSLEGIVEEIGSMPVRLSPVVASELLRGASGTAQRSVEKLIGQLLPLEPQSWRQCWHETGKLLPRIFPHHEEVGLGRLQNDCLLALTARHTGALFVTADAHFDTIRRHVPFRMKRLTT